MSDNNLLGRAVELICALADVQEYNDDGKAIDDAFVWEPRELERKPLVTFGMIREARAIRDKMRELAPPLTFRSIK